MTLAAFIREHRAEIDEAINRALNYVPASASCYCPLSRTEHTHTDARRIDNEERRKWILDDEGLYSWARSAGVRV